MIAINITADYERFINQIKLSIINQLILILIIFVIVYYAFNYYETKIKDLLENEKQNERMLFQQSKMAAMGEMIANIAHQWRQPLSSISTVASGIRVQKEYGIFDEKNLNDSMEKIIRQTHFMSKTIDDFRDFFKSDKEKISFDINTLINNNLSLLETTLINNEISVLIDLDENIKLHGYQNELTQAILNIINNSKDQFIKNNSIKDKIIKINTKIMLDTIEITITDNAGGIADNIINKVFEPYFTTKHQSQGTGIGLYMTHEIIYKHFHGTISVSNETFEYKDNMCRGAKFIIILPIN